MTSANDGSIALSTIEFIALAALLTCLTALSIDIMLPVLPQLAESLDVTDANDRQWVISSYLGGLVIGQLFVGTASDKFGRLPVLYVGLAVFIAGAAIAASASSFTWLLAARVLQGIGGAAPRIVIQAIVRDLYQGRQMARIMSLVMTVFIMVPIFAPSFGQLLALAGGWRTPIYFLAVAGALAMIWAWIRLPETSSRHAHETAGNVGDHQPITFIAAISTVFRSRVTVGYVIASGFMFSCLMSYIMSAQQLFVDVYEIGALFPAAFGAIAIAMAIAAIINSRIVVRLGMRYVSHRALIGFMSVALGMLMISLIYSGKPPFWLLWAGLWLQFLCFGLIVSNFNALAMEPLGQVAGTASSVMGSYTTLISAAFGSYIGQSFNMTALPLNIGFVLFAGAALIIVLITERAGTFGREPAA